MTKPLPLWSRNFEASSNIYPEVESALSAAAGIALTLAQENLKLMKTRTAALYAPGSGVKHPACNSGKGLVQ